MPLTVNFFEVGWLSNIPSAPILKTERRFALQDYYI